jgi:uncharacterized membrane protein
MWYKEREKFLMLIFEKIYFGLFDYIDAADIGYVISFIHYTLMLGSYCWILITNNLLIFVLLFVVIFIQFILNIIDDGCIILKIERKYLGKEWFGFYTALGELLNIEMNATRVKIIFYSIVSITLLYSVKRGVKMLIRNLIKGITNLPGILRLVLLRGAFLIQWIAERFIDTLT